MKNISLRAINNLDIPLLTEWLNKDYILKWYHNPEEWLEEINARNDKFSWIHHFIVMDGNTPIGFCQYYDCFEANDMEAWYEVAQRGTYSIDYLIGNEEYLGKGYGKAIIKLLTTVIEQINHAIQIIVQPDENNQPSNHVLLANGFIFDNQKKYYYKLLKR
jgi:RimJ/RimL family protein N-acetyltransferase